MSEWEAHDAKLAESVGLLLNEQVIWRPQLPPTGGSYTTVAGGRPDPNRPIRDLDAIASWQPTGLPIVAGGVATVTNASLLLDFEMALFQNEYASFGQPKVGDRFECPEQDEADRLLVVQRIGDDGSARLYAWCAVVTEQ